MAIALKDHQTSILNSIDKQFGPQSFEHRAILDMIKWDEEQGINIKNAHKQNLELLRRVDDLEKNNGTLINGIQESESRYKAALEAGKCKDEEIERLNSCIIEKNKDVIDARNTIKCLHEKVNIDTAKSNYPEGTKCPLEEWVESFFYQYGVCFKPKKEEV